MKKRNFVITTVVSILALGILGTTIAVYSNTLEKEVTIGGNILFDGDFTLTEPSVTNEGKLTFDTGVTITSELGFSPSSSTRLTQNRVLGKVEIDIYPTVNTELGENADYSTITDIMDKISVSAKIDGYAGGTYFANFESAFKEEHISFDENENKYRLSKYVWFNTGVDDAKQSISFTIDFAGTAQDYTTYVASNSLSYDIKLSPLGETDDYDIPYITGECNGWVTDNDYYAMIPNFEDTSNFTWIYYGLNVEGASEADPFEYKVYKNGYFSDGTGSNSKILKDGTYTIYFNGSTVSSNLQN